MKIALATGRPETLKEQRKMEFDTGLYFDNSRSSARGDITETVIVPGLPDYKFTDIQEVSKNARSNMQLIRTKTKKNVTTKKNRTHRRKGKHERLKPTQGTLSQGTGEKQMLKGLDRRTTKTGQRDWQSKRDKALGGVKNSMGDLPVQVDNLAIKIEK